MRLNKRVCHGTIGFAAAWVTVGVAPALAAQGGNGNDANGNGAYIVQMVDAPVTAYAGGIAGYAATKPAKGQKIDPNSAAVTRYKAFLAGKQDAALRAVGGGNKLYNYGYVFSGFAANLTADQAAKLAQMPGVLAVTKDELQTATTSSTPAFLGLSAPGGIWSQVKGEGVVIGIVDSGVWPEHPSFSDRTGPNGNGSQGGKLDYQQLPGWHGKCTPGENFNASHCNQKLIGAQYFNAAWGGNAAIDAQRPWEFNSPRDYNGHGTHTASTSGGNAGVVPTGAAAVFGAISGMAPRARIAAYKALWSTESGDTASGFTSDLVAAIDQAVADGVDVINYSISGATSNVRDPVQISFLFAADAGIFVAASAGNSGPTTGTVAHPGPWLTTVAAGTHNRDGQGSATLGNGTTVNGASLATKVGPAPMINSTAAALPGANASAVALCFAAIDNGGVAVLDPAKVAGKIVVCDRGTNARVNKSLAVKEAGGVGMILANVTVNSLNADFHAVPTVHVQNTERAAVQAYAAGSAATATINLATLVFNATAPLTASFSSRGPSPAANGDLLKPDIIAPGQDILAGVAPPTAGGSLFNLLSGTSMSSPHIAGIAALFKELKPTWSPMAIKSALMTTATDVLDGGTPAPNTNPVLIFRQGAGHVRANTAMEPGLVYDSGFGDWLSFICGAQPGGGCTGVTPIDPSNLNLASIAIGDMAGLQTVTRKVRNVSGSNLTVGATVTGMGGFTTTVTPSSMTLAAGEEKAFTVSFLRTGAALNAYTGGQLTWTGGNYVVRSPIVVRPVALAAPAAMSSTGAATSFPVTFGYDGPFSATARGLVAAATTPGTVADDPTDGACSLTTPNAQLISVVVPAGITHARFSLFDADVNAGSDLDLCVFNGATRVGASGTGTSAEEVNLLNPAAGTYTVVVQGFAVAGSTPFKLHTWLLGSAAAGNMAVTAPAVASTGAAGTIGLSFSGLTAGQRYMGSVVFGGTAGMPNPTIVRVDP